MKKYFFILLSLLFFFVSCDLEEKGLQVIADGAIAIKPKNINLSNIKKGTKVTFLMLGPEGYSVKSFKINNVDTKLPEDKKFTIRYRRKHYY